MIDLPAVDNIISHSGVVLPDEIVKRRQRANGETPDTALRRWLDTLPESFRKRLVKIGLLDSKGGAASKPLAQHVADFKAALLAKGNSAKHAEMTATRVAGIVDGCRFAVWSNVSASKVQQQLAKMREAKNGIGRQTSNYYLQSFKAFCKWMVRDGRASESPVEHLQPLNARTDRRHERRALSVDEAQWLLSVTAHAPTRHKMPGAERQLVYRIALETGLRANEIRSLKRRNFDLDGDSSTVTVEAAYSKRRRRDELPLRA